MATPAHGSPAEPDAEALRRHRGAPGAAPEQEPVGESGASLDALRLGATPPDEGPLMGALARADTSTRARTLQTLQRVQGNAVVQRLVQRQAPFLPDQPPSPGPATPLTPGAPGFNPNDPKIVWLGQNPFQPLGPLSKGAPELDIGITPNPADPYEQPPTNWDNLAAGVAGPDRPEAWPGVSKVPLSPLPRLKADGQPSSKVTPDQQAAAQEACAAFESVQVTANTSWNAAAPAITSYADAAKETEGLGILGTHGLGWTPGAPGADLSQVAGQQPIGPQNKTTVEDLFKTKGGTPGTTARADPNAVKTSKQTHEKVVQVNVYKDALVNAILKHVASMKAVLGKKDAYKAAVLKVAIVEAKVAQDQLEDKKRQLEKDKEEAIGTVEGVFATAEAVTLIGFGAFESLTVKPVEGAESILVGLEIAGEAIAKAAVASHYDSLIAPLEGQIKQATQKIRGQEAEVAQLELSAATSDLEKAETDVRTSGSDMVKALSDLQAKYNELAEAAGAAAGGGAKGAQIQAAIEAIPKVEIVLGAIDPVVVAIKLPAYSDLSGEGFNGFGKPADFVQHLGQLKGYQEKFGSLKSTWQARLDSLKAIQGRLAK